MFARKRYSEGYKWYHRWHDLFVVGAQEKWRKVHTRETEHWSSGLHLRRCGGHHTRDLTVWGEKNKSKTWRVTSERIVGGR